MKSMTTRNRELLEPATELSTSESLLSSSTACQIRWPSLYGNPPHGNMNPHTTTEKFLFPSLKMKQDNLDAYFIYSLRLLCLTDSMESLTLHKDNRLDLNAH